VYAIQEQDAGGIPIAVDQQCRAAIGARDLNNGSLNDAIEQLRHSPAILPFGASIR
jgi:hypothetical protein